jgi:predicted DNA-binding transcriptional regulator YafY
MISDAKSDSEELFRAKCKVNSRLRTTFERFRLETALATAPSVDSGKAVSVEVTSFSRDWLVRNFMSTLANTEITEPAELAKAVGQKSQATLELYKNERFSS